MKKTFLFAVVMTLSISSLARAGDLPASVNLEPPAGFAQKICPNPLWSGKTLVWDGATDLRPEKAIGTQSKGDESANITAQPPLETVFDGAVKTLMETCGMKVVSKVGDAALRMSVDVEKFHVDVENKLVTGTGKAESWIKIVLRDGAAVQTAHVGYEMESKGVRSGKKLKKTLDELMFETLAQIPKAEPLKNLK